MISISYVPPDWGFGNRLLFYNNLRQLAEKSGEVWHSVFWDGCDYFTGNMLSSNTVVEDKNFYILDPCLGEHFFDWNVVSTRSIFELKEKPKVEEGSVAIHFRGTDFFSWNFDAVLDKNYYMDAIDAIEDAKTYYLFTDDTTLPAYNSVLSRLDENESNNIIVGENTPNRNNYIKDFSVMSECEYIISSPSTYCICAGFIGKIKKIIHSEKWLDNRRKVNDKFWVGLYNGGNDDYKIWRAI